MQSGKVNLFHVLKRTKVQRDLGTLLAAAEAFETQLRGFSSEHGELTVATELINAGILVSAQLNDNDVWGPIEEAAQVVEDVDCFLWTLRLFIGVLSSARLSEEDLPPLQPLPPDVVARAELASMGSQVPCVVDVGKEVA
jgi:hypothetical protein